MAPSLPWGSGGILHILGVTGLLICVTKCVYMYIYRQEDANRDTEVDADIAMDIWTCIHIDTHIDMWLCRYIDTRIYTYTCLCVLLFICCTNLKSPRSSRPGA